MFVSYLTFLNDLDNAVSLHFYFLIVKCMKNFILNYNILKSSTDRRWLQYTVEDYYYFCYIIQKKHFIINCKIFFTLFLSYIVHSVSASGLTIVTHGC